MKWDHDRVIDEHPELANGWTRESLKQIKEALRGRVVILGGLLRVLPPQSDSILATGNLKGQIEGHVQAGRLPILY
jgi:hypothetical protein